MILFRTPYDSSVLCFISAGLRGFIGLGWTGFQLLKETFISQASGHKRPIRLAGCLRDEPKCSQVGRNCQAATK